MNTALNFLLYSSALLGVAALVMGIRVLLQRRELRDMERRRLYRRAAFKRRLHNGSVDVTFLRMLAEFAVMILLLLVVFGWLGCQNPRW